MIVSGGEGSAGFAGFYLVIGLGEDAEACNSVSFAGFRLCVVSQGLARFAWAWAAGGGGGLTPD